MLSIGKVVFQQKIKIMPVYVYYMLSNLALFCVSIGFANKFERNVLSTLI